VRVHALAIGFSPAQPSANLSHDDNLQVQYRDYVRLDILFPHATVVAVSMQQVITGTFTAYSSFFHSPIQFVLTHFSQFLFRFLKHFARAYEDLHSPTILR